MYLDLVGVLGMDVLRRGSFILITKVQWEKAGYKEQGSYANLTFSRFLGDP
jgi:hypothetical protein